MAITYTCSLVETTFLKFLCNRLLLFLLECTRELRIIELRRKRGKGPYKHILHIQVSK